MRHSIFIFSRPASLKKSSVTTAMQDFLQIAMRKNILIEKAHFGDYLVLFNFL